MIYILKYYGTILIFCVECKNIFDHLLIKLNFDTNKNDSAITLDNYFKLLLFIRRELGHKNKGIKEKDILKLFVTSEKDYEELCRKLGYKKQCFMDKKETADND